jgi:hypothetical protein
MWKIRHVKKLFKKIPCTTVALIAVHIAVVSFHKFHEFDLNIWSFSPY